MSGLFEHGYPYTDSHEINLSWVILKVKELAEAWAQVQQDWTDEQAAFANLQSWIENYFNNLNVQTEINLKLDAMVAAGTMSELIAPYVASGLPAVVAAQIGDVVAAQIGPVVAAQISAVVADQLPAVAAAAAAAEVSTWLAAHVDPETGYVIDDTFTVQGAAADAKAVGDEFTAIKSALTSIENDIQYNEPLNYIDGGYIASNVGIGNTVSLTPVSNANFAYLIYPCTAGTKFAVKGVNTNTVKSWAFIDENDKLLSVCTDADQSTTNAIIIAPENTANVIIQSRKLVGDDYSANIIKSLTQKNKNDITKLNTYNFKLENAPFNGGYIALNVGIGNTVDTTVISSTSFNNTIIDCSEGDEFIVSSTGSNTVRCYGFIDENNLLLAVASSNVTLTNEKIVAPANAKKVIVEGYSDQTLSCKYEISTIEELSKKYKNVYDIIMFAGQSNMAGRGTTNESHPETYPQAIKGCGYEYRAITAPNQLYPITEPFGYAENKSGGLDDGNNKTGDCVVSFANAYYTFGGVPIIAVSASEGATDLLEWVTGYSENAGRLYDATQRLRSCISFCNNNNIPIRHIFVVWCQGETDAKYIYDEDPNFTMQDYVDRFDTCQQAFLDAGAEKLLMIRIGKRAGTNGEDTGLTTYDAVIEKQTELAQTDNDLVMVCTDLAGMRARGLMKDPSHYYQVAYNEFGTYAGINSAIYANTGKEPTMYDTYYNNLYYSHKN